MSNPLCDNLGMNLICLIIIFPIPDLSIYDFIFSPGSPRVEKSVPIFPFLQIHQFFL